ncbi:MlaD family protein [Chryseobacterium sp. Hurlbut01]|uniref:MlaD family protein n=1 Tax=Chryseobacterium sp. Hurlbut01 TaxID=1681828 RepID=UPI000B2F5BDB|nr:MlaD family protein [Chryseobacterium sp. Hurlbut01]
MAGFALLTVAFFYISKGSSIFTSKFTLKAKFENAQGLKEGSNVLFAGIQAGTVKSILLESGTIEVTMLIDKKVAGHIDNNAKVYIGTEGVIGNAIVNIVPSEKKGVPTKDGDYLEVQKKAGIDEMLKTLSKSNNNIMDISESLKETVLRINDSEILNLIDDKESSKKLKMSMEKIYHSTANIEAATSQLNEMISDAKQGKGAAGLLLADKDFENQIRHSFDNINTASKNLTAVTENIQDFSETLNNGKGPINTLLKDSVLTEKISTSLDNVKKGTEGLNQNMEALKHNFLFRGYFRKQEKKERKDK